MNLYGNRQQYDNIKLTPKYDYIWLYIMSALIASIDCKILQFEILKKCLLPKFVLTYSKLCNGAVNL